MAQREAERGRGRAELESHFGAHRVDVPIDASSRGGPGRGAPYRPNMDRIERENKTGLSLRLSVPLPDSSRPANSTAAAPFFFSFSAVLLVSLGNSISGLHHGLVVAVLRCVPGGPACLTSRLPGNSSVQPQLSIHPPARSA